MGGTEAPSRDERRPRPSRPAKQEPCSGEDYWRLNKSKYRDGDRCNTLTHRRIPMTSSRFFVSSHTYAAHEERMIRVTHTGWPTFRCVDLKTESSRLWFLNGGRGRGCVSLRIPLAAPSHEGGVSHFHVECPRLVMRLARFGRMRDCAASFSPLRPSPFHDRHSRFRQLFRSCRAMTRLSFKRGLLYVFKSLLSRPRIFSIPQCALKNPPQLRSSKTMPKFARGG